MLNNEKISVDGSSKTLKEYADSELNLSSCVPENTPYFSATYKCGNVTSTNVINKKTISDYVLFNCSKTKGSDNDKYDCGMIILELMDDGQLVVHKKDIQKNKTLDSTIYWSWTPTLSSITKSRIMQMRFQLAAKTIIYNPVIL